MLFSLGGSFLYYADRFKIYSAFCASHTKVPKVLAKGKTGENLLLTHLMGAHQKTEQGCFGCVSSLRHSSVVCIYFCILWIAEMFLLFQQKPTPISRPSWPRETPDSSIRPLWSRTWSNPSREFWSTLCCWRSSTPSLTLTAKSTTTWMVNVPSAFVMPFISNWRWRLLLSRLVATKAMNKVASHINEMQKLHEEYGAVFDQLINEQTAMKKEVKALAHWFARVSVCLGPFARWTGLFCDLSLPGGWSLHGWSSAALHRGVDQPPCLAGQEQKGATFSSVW